MAIGTPQAGVARVGQDGGGHIQAAVRAAAPTAHQKVPVAVTENKDEVVIQSGDITVRIRKTSGGEGVR